MSTFEILRLPCGGGGRTFESCQSQREARRKTSLIIFKAINQFKIITDTIRTGVNGLKKASSAERFLGKLAMEGEFSERRRRRGSKQEVCDRRGESCQSQIGSFIKERAFFILNQ